MLSPQLLCKSSVAPSQPHFKRFSGQQNARLGRCLAGHSLRCGVRYTGLNIVRIVHCRLVRAMRSACFTIGQTTGETRPPIEAYVIFGVVRAIDIFAQLIACEFYSVVLVDVEYFKRTIRFRIVDIELMITHFITILSRHQRYRHATHRRDKPEQGGSCDDGEHDQLGYAPHAASPNWVLRYRRTVLLNWLVNPI